MIFRGRMRSGASRHKSRLAPRRAPTLAARAVGACHNGETRAPCSCEEGQHSRARDDQGATTDSTKP